MVSFIAGDKGDFREEYKEKSGYQCAQYLIEFCKRNNLELPTCYVHSMNPVGAENIKQLLDEHNRRRGIHKQCIKTFWALEKD